MFDLLVDTGFNIFGKKIKKRILSLEGSGKTLTNNETKDIVKVVRLLENKKNLLKGTTRKISSQDGGFLSFFRLIMSAGLPLMKSVLIPLVKSVL